MKKELFLKGFLTLSLFLPQFKFRQYLSPLLLTINNFHKYEECMVGSQSGSCVFSLSCHHSGGYSIGICRHRFFFGSCCQLQKVPIRTMGHDIFPTDICGTRSEIGRILGGHSTRFGSWPWQISIQIILSEMKSRHRCGAILISAQWAITAAHCVHYYKKSELFLRLGDYNRVHDDEPLPHMDRMLSKIIEHEKYDPRNFDNDLALLRMETPVDLFPHIRPLCLPYQDEVVTGKIGFVTGWGQIYEDGPITEVLHEVSVPIFDHGKCNALFKMAMLEENVTDIFICAGEDKGGKDACEGDSGGPLVIESADTHRWTLAGIISWGRGCGERYQPGVYTRVPLYINWITEKLVKHN